MKSEKEIIKKIVELAKESARREIYIKQEEKAPCGNNEDSINAHNAKIEEMKKYLYVTDAELRTLVEIF